MRLVSQYEGPLTWIVGGFYNQSDFVGISSEFTPFYGDFAFGPGTSSALNDLEYYAVGKSELTEKAVFGEIGYELTDAWQVTGGIRLYNYKLDTADAVTLPGSSDTVTTVFFPYFDCPAESCGIFDLDDVDDAYEVARNQDFSGELFKLNTSYKFDNGNSVYATFSQGYRIGASNGLAPCPDIFVDGPQGQCGLVPGQQFGPNPGDIAQINEREYFPDTVDNFEIGYKSRWLDGDLTFNAAAYFIKWDDIQIVSSSVNAGLTITVNGGQAESKGVELSGDWRINDNFSLRGNYSYTDAELTQDVPALVRTLSPGGGFATAFEDGADGDRLPGSPKHQFSIFGAYEQPLYSGNLFANAGLSYQGNVLSRVGGRGSSLTLQAFERLNASIGYEQDNWSLTAYAENLLNDYSESSVNRTQLFNQNISGANVRSFRTSVLPPRVIGARFSYKFNQ